MRHPIWLLALVVSAGLACAKEKVSETSPPTIAAATPATTYTLTVTFEGLVGYVNTSSGAWALLPKADPAVALPHHAADDPAHYPRHYAVLKVSGKNVRGFGLPVDLQIPIDGYDLVLPASVFGGGSGLDATKFRQDGVDAAVDKLASGMLNVPTPADPSLLAARMKLPKTDLTAHEGTNDKFAKVYPGTKVAGNCPENATTGAEKRVETVTWSPSLSGDLTLTLRPFGGTAFSLVLGPASGETAFEVRIANQVAEALVNPNHSAAHWAAYRWFYSLSNPAVHDDCTKHYYPNGPFGGNRCPQKLYTE